MLASIEFAVLIRARKEFCEWNWILKLHQKRSRDFFFENLNCKSKLRNMVTKNLKTFKLVY